MVQHYHDLWARRSDMLAPLTALVGWTGFHPVWITVRHFHVGLVLSRVVPIFYVLFAPAGFFFCETPFRRFFCDVTRYLTKKRPIVHFFRARVCASQVICTKYAINNCNICCLAVAPTLRANQPEFKDWRARLNRFHT
jgi:hypothetical protein